MHAHIYINICCFSSGTIHPFTNENLTHTHTNTHTLTHTQHQEEGQARRVHVPRKKEKWVHDYVMRDKSQICHERRVTAYMLIRTTEYMHIYIYVYTECIPQSLCMYVYMCVCISVMRKCDERQVTDMSWATSDSICTYKYQRIYIFIQNVHHRIYVCMCVCECFADENMWWETSHRHVVSDESQPIYICVPQNIFICIYM